MEELMLTGKLPPHSKEAEQAVLGAILLDQDKLILVGDFIKAEDFYFRNHEIIYDAMVDLYDRATPIDTVTVHQYLSDKNLLDEAGGAVYLADLGNNVPFLENIEHYGRIIEEKSILRKLIQAATTIAQTGYSGDNEVAEILDSAERKIFEVSQRKIGKAFAQIKDVLPETVDRIEKLSKERGKVTGIATGYSELDRMTSGFQKSDLIILAARPSVGKTAFALNIAQNIGVHTEETVAIFSLEMSKEQLVQRMLSAESHVDSQRLRTGQLLDDEWPRLTQGMSQLSKAKIFIDDSAMMTVMEMRAKLRRLQSEHGLGIVIIDYLQLMHSHRRSENRQQEISEISRGLKALARELNVPVIALSQLSRSIEQRSNKKPLLSDIRESGSIEQDADIVGFLSREDYQNDEAEENKIIEVIIAKHRNGPIGEVQLLFLKEINRFVNLDQAHSS